jgi:hypothetical protein
MHEPLMALPRANEPVKAIAYTPGYPLKYSTKPFKILIALVGVLQVLNSQYKFPLLRADLVQALINLPSDIGSTYDSNGKSQELDPTG